LKLSEIKGIFMKVKQIELVNVVEISRSLEDLQPKEIVSKLDNYIIGQEKAKRLVAIALRNRIRRKFVPPELRDEILPKNILMIGPTGVGKTEIARRIAQIVDAPFIKVEATKFTERGYVGRDVEYMIRALVNHSINLVKSRMRERLKEEVENEVIKFIAREIMHQAREKGKYETLLNYLNVSLPQTNKVFNALCKYIKENKMDDYEVKIQLKRKNIPFFPFMDALPGMEGEDDINMFLGDLNPDFNEEKVMTVKEAKEAVFQQIMDEKVDKDRAVEIGLKWAQESGIIFIDEIDKISDKASGYGPEVSREGVQRDLLPIVEGTNVNTKYGIVKTDHILFIAAGAFHVCKPSDMIPELQGRFPIRVELNRLTKDDLRRILTEPKNSLIKQYKALLETEKVKLEFEEKAINRIVDIAYEINSRLEDIGARRLHTVMEYLLEDISFDAPELKGRTITVTEQYVEEKLSSIIQSSDLTQYIL